MKALKERPRPKGKKPPSKQFIQQMNQSGYGVKVSTIESQSAAKPSIENKTKVSVEIESKFYAKIKSIDEKPPPLPFKSRLSDVTSISKQTNSNSFDIKLMTPSGKNITNTRASHLKHTSVQTDDNMESGVKTPQRPYSHTPANVSRKVPVSSSSPRASCNTPVNMKLFGPTISLKNTPPPPIPKKVYIGVAMAGRSSLVNIPKIDMNPPKKEAPRRISFDVTNQFSCSPDHQNSKSPISPRPTNELNDYLYSKASSFQTQSFSARTSEVKRKPRNSSIDQADPAFLKLLEATPPNELDEDTSAVNEPLQEINDDDSNSQHDDLIHQRSKMTKRVQHTKLRMSKQSVKRLSHSRQMKSPEDGSGKSFEFSMSCDKQQSSDTTTIREAWDALIPSTDDPYAEGDRSTSDICSPNSHCSGVLTKSSPLVDKSVKPRPK